MMYVSEDGTPLPLPLPSVVSEMVPARLYVTFAAPVEKALSHTSRNRAVAVTSMAAEGGFVVAWGLALLEGDW